MFRGLIGGAALLAAFTAPVQADLLDQLLGGNDPFPIGGGTGGTITSGSSGSTSGTGSDSTDGQDTGSGDTGAGSAGTGDTGTDTGTPTSDDQTPASTTKSNRFLELIATAQGEVEPNNHLAAADPLQPGQPIKGQLFATEDEDWFSVRTTQANAVMNVEMPSGPASWRISIRDQAGNLLASKDSSTDINEDLVFSVTLEKQGDYYVVVSSVDDSREDYVFNVSGDQLANPGGRNPEANFHDAETEFNNVLDDANSLGSAVQLVGHLSTSGDVDIYKLDSDGDEILSLELCPGNATCGAQLGEEGGPWVIYVFDGSQVTQEMLDEERPLVVCVGKTTPSTVFVNHLYLSLNDGVFRDALLGVIDPAFGNSKRVEVGLANPGTYFVVVSSPLKRDEDGSVRIKEEVECGKDAEGNALKIEEQKIVVFPFSDDQYDLRVVKTRLTPSLEVPESASQAALRPAFSGDVLVIPVVEANGMEYSAELAMFRKDGKIMFELLSVNPLGTKQAVTDSQALQQEAFKASLDNGIVHVPMAGLNGHYYSGDLRMFEENGKLLFELIRSQRLD